MAISKVEKQEIIKAYAVHEGDTGCLLYTSAFINMKAPSQSATAATPPQDYKYTYVSEELDVEPMQEVIKTDTLDYIFNSHDGELYEGGAVNEQLGRTVSVVDLSYMLSLIHI